MTYFVNNTKTVYENFHTRFLCFLPYRNLRKYSVSVIPSKGIVKGSPLNIEFVKIGGVYLDFNTMQGLAR